MRHTDVPAGSRGPPPAPEVTAGDSAPPTLAVPVVPSAGRIGPGPDRPGRCSLSHACAFPTTRWEQWQSLRPSRPTNRTGAGQEDEVVPTTVFLGDRRDRRRRAGRLAGAGLRQGDGTDRHDVRRRDADAHRPDRVPHDHRRHRQRRRPQAGRLDRGQSPGLLPVRHPAGPGHRAARDQPDPAGQRRQRRRQPRSRSPTPSTASSRRARTSSWWEFLTHIVPSSMVERVRRGRHPADHLPGRHLRCRPQRGRPGRRPAARPGAARHQGHLQDPLLHHEARPAGRVRGDGLRHRQVRRLHPDQPRRADRPVLPDVGALRARRPRLGHGLPEAQHLQAAALPEGGAAADRRHLHRRAGAARPDAQAGARRRQEQRRRARRAHRLLLQPRRRRDLPVAGRGLPRPGHRHEPDHRPAARPDGHHAADLQGRGRRRRRRVHRPGRHPVHRRHHPARRHHADLRHRQVHVRVPGAGQLHRQRRRHPVRRQMGPGRRLRPGPQGPGPRAGAGPARRDRRHREPARRGEHRSSSAPTPHDFHHHEHHAPEAALHRRRRDQEARRRRRTPFPRRWSAMRRSRHRCSAAAPRPPPTPDGGGTAQGERTSAGRSSGS